MSTIRHPAVAGTFYPGTPAKLRADVTSMLSQPAPVSVAGDIVGIVAPHAGYIYSGQTAAHAYALLRGRSFDTVVVIGPSHYEAFNGVTLTAADAYETPMGTVPVDHVFQKELKERCRIAVTNEAGHRKEHSIEVQLPFLQGVLDSFSFVPIPIGDQREGTIHELAVALAATAENKRVLFVASSDLSHYHPYKDAVRLDQRVVQKLAAFDADGLFDLFEMGQAEACGASPILSVLQAARKLHASACTIVHYCNSGDVSGNRDAVVGYCAAVLSRQVS